MVALHINLLFLHQASSEQVPLVHWWSQTCYRWQWGRSTRGELWEGAIMWRADTASHTCASDSANRLLELLLDFGQLWIRTNSTFTAAQVVFGCIWATLMDINGYNWYNMHKLSKVEIWSWPSQGTCECLCCGPFRGAAEVAGRGMRLYYDDGLLIKWVIQNPVNFWLPHWGNKNVLSVK